MNPNMDIVSALLKDVATNPTGFSAGQTIKYGVLPVDFLVKREGVDPDNYAEGTNDPAYQAALANWTAKRGKDLQPVTAAQMAMIDQAFAAIGKLVGVTFQRDDANANIRFGTADLNGMPADDKVSPLGGYNVRQYTGNPATDFNAVVMPRSYDTNGNAQGYFVTLMHEIEHALGVAHPGDYTKGAEVYAGLQDNAVDTIMSYRIARPSGYPDVLTDAAYGSLLQSSNAAGRTVSPARYDILALQALLGINTATQSTSDVFSGFQDAQDATGKWIGQTYVTIFDAGGSNDTLDASSSNKQVRINLEPGTASSIGGPDKNVVIAFNTLIENAIGGTKNDILIGNDVANTLTGGKGEDTLKGGKGIDTYVIGEDTDTIYDSEGDGKILVGSGKYQLKGSTKAQITDKTLNARGTAWKDDTRSDLFYVLKKGDTLDDGMLLVISRQDNKDSIICQIENFKNGNLGITLKDEKKLALLSQDANNPFAPENADKPLSTQLLDFAENLGEGLKVFLNQAAKAGGTITLTLSALGDKFKAVLGDDIVGFDSGNVTLTLDEGQTEIAFALLSTGDVDAKQSLTLSATLNSADGSSGVVNSLGINFDANAEMDSSPVTTNVVACHNHPIPFFKLLRSTGKIEQKSRLTVTCNKPGRGVVEGNWREVA